MKIFYLVALSEGKFPNVKIWYEKADNYLEANKIIQGSIDREIYELLKTLEDNEDFDTDILGIRRKHDIPQNGYSLEEWDDIKKQKKEDGSYSNWRLEVDKSSRELSKRFKIPYLLHNSLSYIVLGNFIYLPLTKMFLDLPYQLQPTYDGPSIGIHIYGQTSKEQIKKFIDNNWTLIDKEMSVFKDETSAYISSTSREIMQLRDKKKMKFVEIADYLAEKSNNYDITEDMVKKAYHRAKSKIISLKR